MAAQILDGKIASADLIGEVSDLVAERRDHGKRPPGLAVVLVGDDPASAVYVRNKEKACERAGIRSFAHHLPTDVTQKQLLALVDQLNQDSRVDGILVQLPLPSHIEEHRITNAIEPRKDVDGFHAENVGRLALRQPGLRPCTPLGIMALLNRHDIDVKGKHAVVVGASNIVGRPMTLELLLAGATVTCCHRFTKNLQKHVHDAEVLVVAVGRRDVVDANWISPGCIVIDVGIHRASDGTLSGDLDFKQAAESAAWITPVPGGVGPMTVAGLMRNTLTACELAEEACSGSE